MIKKVEYLSESCPFAYKQVFGKVQKNVLNLKKKKQQKKTKKKNTHFSPNFVVHRRTICQGAITMPIKGYSPAFPYQLFSTFGPVPGSLFWQKPIQWRLRLIPELVQQLSAY